MCSHPCFAVCCCQALYQTWVKILISTHLVCLLKIIKKSAKLADCWFSFLLPFFLVIGFLQLSVLLHLFFLHRGVFGYYIWYKLMHLQGTTKCSESICLLEIDNGINRGLLSMRKNITNYSLHFKNMKTIKHKVLYPESPTDYPVGRKRLLHFIENTNGNYE